MQPFGNPELQLAFDYVQLTGKNIFLTGKAGTGKTTFLHNLKRESPKRMVVLAPTGVAAINAGGVTIHSFFQMAFGPHIPADSSNRIPQMDGVERADVKRFSREKVNIIKSIDLLVIDEISMVRADLLDGVDEVLRKYRDRNRPFGGVQLLMIGDLQQLAPVVKDDDWNLLRDYYDTPFFFGSRALRDAGYVSIELKEVFRQSDGHFISILNQVRENRLDAHGLEVLNRRYDPNFNKEEHEGYITLTTHNYQSQELNQRRLSMLKGKLHSFAAEVEGEFPEYSYPTDHDLQLKVGAQVMFVKNDTSAEKLFYNGKIGVIADIDNDIAYVKCPDDMSEIPVGRLEWNNYKYSIDDATKEIVETAVGKFVQYPLKLAWAITIHKSQGLTFERAVIDAKAAFAHGQVYVALSRCKTLEGMVLSSPISDQCIKSDVSVDAISREIEQNPPTRSSLDRSKREYEESLLLDLFNFSLLNGRLFYLIKIADQHAESLPPGLADALRVIALQVKENVINVAEKFKGQLFHLFNMPGSLQESAMLHERVVKASSYFAERIATILVTGIAKLSLESDNKVVRKSITDSYALLEREIEQKQGGLAACKEGFNVAKYLLARAKASIEKSTTRMKRLGVSKGEGKHPKLYLTLRDWRDAKAVEFDCPEYMVLPLKTLAALVSTLPQTTAELKLVKGMGAKKVTQFGVDILDIICDYCAEVGIAATAPRLDSELEQVPRTKKQKEPTAPKQKGETYLTTLKLFVDGMSVEEIAALRGMSKTTIEGHFARLIQAGELSILKFMESPKVDEIARYFYSNGMETISAAKEHFGDRASYAELRYVMAHIRGKSE
jgi:ATP-dependent exoDNAse (exonuclease V), alpha subunit - helicase superfamily I member